MIESKSKIRTNWDWKPKNKSIEPHQNFIGFYKKSVLYCDAGNDQMGMNINNLYIYIIHTFWLFWK